MRPLPPKAPAPGVRPLRSHQPGQTRQSLLARSRRVAQTHVTRGKDGALRHARSQGDRRPDRLHRPRHAFG